MSQSTSSQHSASQQTTAPGSPLGETRVANDTQRSSSSTRSTSQPSGRTADRVRQQAADLKDNLSSQASEATSAARRKAAEATEQAKASASKYASEKKGMVAEEIGVFSGAIRKASGKLREEKHDSIASYVDAAAEQLDHLRHSLQNRSTREILGDLQGLTRRRPELVYGGLFVAGLAAMRFLKASKPRRRSYDRDYDRYGREGNFYRESTSPQASGGTTPSSSRNQPDYSGSSMPMSGSQFSPLPAGSASSPATSEATAPVGSSPSGQPGEQSSKTAKTSSKASGSGSNTSNSSGESR